MVIINGVKEGFIMFIATGVDLNRGLAQVLDTSDGSNDVVNLAVVAKQVNSTSKPVKVWGIKKGLVGKPENGDINIPALNITISQRESQQAIQREWNKGLRQ